MLCINYQTKDGFLKISLTFLVVQSLENLKIFPRPAKIRAEFLLHDKMVLIEVKIKYCNCCFSEIPGKRKTKRKNLM